jgi:ATP-binding cassette subfamily G (WHITE) protein 2
MMVVFGLIVGLIYLRLSDDSKGIQNRVGGFFFIIINLVFGNMGTIELFMAERTLYR